MQNIFVQWSAPYDGGSPLTSYTIQIRHKDGTTFSEDLTDCDGTDTTIIAEAKCTVPIATLRSTYGYDYGDSIWAKVKTANIVG